MESDPAVVTAAGTADRTRFAFSKRLRVCGLVHFGDYTFVSTTACVSQSGSGDEQKVAAGSLKDFKGTFTSLLSVNGADPWSKYYDGNFYLTTTTWTSQLVMRKSANFGWFGYREISQHLVSLRPEALL